MLAAASATSCPPNSAAPTQLLAAHCPVLCPSPPHSSTGHCRGGRAPLRSHNPVPPTQLCTAPTQPCTAYLDVAVGVALLQQGGAQARGQAGQHLQAWQKAQRWVGGWVGGRGGGWGEWKCRQHQAPASQAAGHQNCQQQQQQALTSAESSVRCASTSSKSAALMPLAISSFSSCRSRQTHENLNGDLVLKRLDCGWSVKNAVKQIWVLGDEHQVYTAITPRPKLARPGRKAASPIMPSPLCRGQCSLLPQPLPLPPTPIPSGPPPHPPAAGLPPPARAPPPLSHPPTHLQQDRHLLHVLHQALGHQHHAVVLALLSALGHHVGNLQGGQAEGGTGVGVRG